MKIQFKKFFKKSFRNISKILGKYQEKNNANMQDQNELHKTLQECYRHYLPSKKFIWVLNNLERCSFFICFFSITPFQFLIQCFQSPEIIKGPNVASWYHNLLDKQPGCQWPELCVYKDLNYTHPVPFQIGMAQVSLFLEFFSFFYIKYFKYTGN